MKRAAAPTAPLRSEVEAAGIEPAQDSPRGERALGDRIPGRIARIREIRRERGHIVYVLTDSLRKPQGKPAIVRADWRRAA